MGKLKRKSESQLSKMSVSQIKEYNEKHERAAKKESEKKAQITKAKKYAK
jgi:hypothetical protein